MAKATVSKTRTVDKSKPPSVPTPEHEIVPGKFSDTDWNHMLEKDCNEEFVEDIIDELINVTMDVIFKKYIDRQLLPFTITEAKDALVEIIQWHFLARDDGEQNINSDLGWAEDEEPEPADTDCWAKGSIPKNVIAASASQVLKTIPEVPGEENVTDRISVTQTEEVPQEPAELPDSVSDTEELPPVTVAQFEAEQKFDIRSEVKFNADSCKSRSSGARRKTKEDAAKEQHDEILESVDKSSIHSKVPNICFSYIKAMGAHSTGTKDALFDELGNVLAVPKLDPEKLPTHKVNVKYTVVDPNTETSQVKVDTKKGMSSIKRKKRNLSSSSDISNRENVSKQGQRASVTRILPAPLFDDVEVSQGITIREHGQVKKGPGLYYRRLDLLEECQKGMKPVSLKISNPEITVADLLDRQSPILRPFGESPPLPPIVPHLPQTAKQIS